jgi:hypothetical protein
MAFHAFHIPAFPRPSLITSEAKFAINNHPTRYVRNERGKVPEDLALFADPTLLLLLSFDEVLRNGADERLRIIRHGHIALQNLLG